VGTGCAQEVQDKAARCGGSKRRHGEACDRPGPAWLLVAGLTGHGCKDLWQHQSHYVANTRWWPPFCLVVDWVAAAILVVLITAGVDVHH
jgi:hypothetical protein